MPPVPALTGGPPLVPRTKKLDLSMDAEAEIADIFRRLRSVELDVTTLQAQMTGAREDIGEMKADVKDLITAVNTNGDVAKRAANSISTATKVFGGGITGLGVLISWFELWPK